MIIILLVIGKRSISFFLTPSLCYIHNMDRDFKTLGIIIRKVKTGERNALLSILTPDSGIIPALSYGSGRGASNARTPIYGEGLFSLERKKESSFTLKDSEIISDHESVKSSLGVLASLSLFSELLIKMRASESSLYKLFVSVLDSIDESSRDKCTVYFLSHFLLIEGLSGDWERCPVCGREYLEGEVLGFSSLTNSAVCSSCDTFSSTLILPPNARRYIHALSHSSIDEALSYTISEGFLRRIRDYLIRSLEYIIPGELLSLKSGLI